MLLELSSEFVLSGLREPVYFITLAFKENSSFADICWYSPILFNIFGTKCPVTTSKQIKVALKAGGLLLVVGELSHTVNLWKYHYLHSTAVKTHQRNNNDVRKPGFELWPMWLQKPRHFPLCHCSLRQGNLLLVKMFEITFCRFWRQFAKTSFRNTLNIMKAELELVTSLFQWLWNSFECRSSVA